MRKHIAELINKVLDEETHIVDHDGKMTRGTMEEALVRVTVKRALDPRSRLGMEAQRFLTEYQYGKPVQPTAIAFRNTNKYDDLDTDELYKRQMELFKGGMCGSFDVTPEDPTRVIGEEQRAEVVQHLLDTRGDTRAAGTEASVSRRAEEKERIEEAAVVQDDELLMGMWDL